MLNFKKQLSVLLAASMLFSGATLGTIASASTYVYPDTTEVVAGVEVFKSDSISNWMKSYVVQGGTNQALYLTHDAYQGSSAMLVKSDTVNVSDITNNGIQKTGHTNSVDNMVVGDTYKIEMYQKPIQKASTDTYNLSKGYRYYDDYDVYQMTAYDTDTGALVDGGTTVQNKWYRLEREFVANGSDVSGANGAMAIWAGPDCPAFLVDEIKMYHKVDGVWVAMSAGTAITNGDFETGVDSIYGLDPENVTAVNKIGSAIISWTNPLDQQTKIYNGNTLLATAAVGDTSATINGLEAGVEYTLTVKGSLNGKESAGVNVTVTPTSAVYSDTLDVISGVEVFKSGSISSWMKNYLVGNGGNQAIYLTHDAYKGSSAMLVKSDTVSVSDVTNVGYKKTGNTNPVDNIVVGDTYKIEMYQKPIQKGSTSTYNLCKDYRYYDNYDVFQMTAYDADTGVLVDSGTTIQSKWYRLEREFVATNADAGGTNGALAIWADSSFPAFLVDEIKMYHKVNGSWVAMSAGTTITNGDFETGVESIHGLNPENVTVVNKTESAIISWTNPQSQKTKIYNGATLLATAEKDVTSITLTGLTANTEYNLTLKGVGSQTESDGVLANAFPFARLSDTVNIISGVEVCSNGAAQWLSTFQDRPATIYTTREAYEGNGALLIVPSIDGNSYPANYNLSKASTSNTDTDKIISGDTYKVVYYEKPVSVGTSGTYTLAKTFRYYDNYDGYTGTIYDAATGAAVGANDVITSKWYKIETEFTAKDGSVVNNVGFAIQTSPTSSTFILDSLSMYHKVNGEWILMKDGTGVRNGSLEEGITADQTAPYEVENFVATAGKGRANLSWDAVEVSDLAGYSIWNGSTKIADVARNVTSYVITGLTNDVLYTFTIKAYDRSGNVSEGTTVSVTPTIPVYETGNYVAGTKLVQGNNTVSINVTNNKRTEGLNVQLILGLFDVATDTLVKASASDQKQIAIGSSDTLTAGLTVDDLTKGNYELRVFLWQSLDSVSPLKGSIAIGE